MLGDKVGYLCSVSSTLLARLSLLVQKKKEKKIMVTALRGSALISLPACAGATVFSCSWLRHHRHFYSPFPFAARALHVESALC